MAKLSVRDVWKSFGAHEVLRGLSLEIDKGQMVCLIGASGSGKSTLLRCLNLLEPVDDGEILLDGQDITDPDLDPQPVRPRIGTALPSFHLSPRMPAQDTPRRSPRPTPP